MLVDVNPGDFVYPNAVCVAVYDGDTCYLDLDLGFNLHRSNRNQAGRYTKGYRLLDINAPEIRPLATRQAATEARDYLASLLLGQRLLVHTVENPNQQQDDDFGRYLARIRVFDGTQEGFDVNQAMLDSGHAVPYQP